MMWIATTTCHLQMNCVCECFEEKMYHLHFLCQQLSHVCLATTMGCKKGITSSKMLRKSFEMEISTFCLRGKNRQKKKELMHSSERGKHFQLINGSRFLQSHLRSWSLPVTICSRKKKNKFPSPLHILLLVYCSTCDSNYISTMGCGET